MRNPHVSCSKIPKAKFIGKQPRRLLEDACNHPSVSSLVENVLESKYEADIDEDWIQHVRSVVTKFLAPLGVELPCRSAKADSPLQPEIIKAWGIAVEDPDAPLLADWVLTGAPLGFSHKIPNTGIFPAVESSDWDIEAARALERPLIGWENHPSAVEYSEDVKQLIYEAHGKGFCSIYDSLEEAERDVGKSLTLNKLGLIVKITETARKARIIWDMRESGINRLCDQGERILLPRVSDIVEDTLKLLRENRKPIFLAVDVRDAFHNVPSNEDKAFTAAAFVDNGVTKIVVYDVLVFGSVSSPTLWGRFSSLLGRMWASILPEVGLQIYVDDPIASIDVDDPNHKTVLGILFLWAKLVGFPLKMEKSELGKSVKWIGAKLDVDWEQASVNITIPEKKLEELTNRIVTLAKKPVIGRKQLQSLAGALPL